MRRGAAHTGRQQVIRDRRPYAERWLTMAMFMDVHYHADDLSP